MMIKLETFLANNDLAMPAFTWAARRDEYLNPDSLVSLLTNNFLGTVVMYGDGVKLTVIADIEPHTGDNIIELHLEDFKHGNFSWSRI